MAITRLQRRQKKNRLNAIKKQQTIKDLLACPVIKNIDIEALKAEFEKKLKAAESKKAKSDAAKVKAGESKVAKVEVEEKKEVKAEDKMVKEVKGEEKKVKAVKKKVVKEKSNEHL